MSDDIIFTSDTDSTSYIESLAKTRQLLAGTDLITKLDLVIAAELDLALLSAEKARSDLLKSNKDNNVKPIK